MERPEFFLRFWITLSKDAKTLLFAISARKEESNGLFAADTRGDAPVEIIAGRGRYNHLTWNEEQTSWQL